MKSLRLLSPAKLNLFLKVNFKRPDGYHDLTTVFERISLCDELTFTSNATGAIKIFCNHPFLPRGPQNLVYQAAQLLKDECGLKEGVDIKIIKKIPIAAGLGGGSGNAATALMGLNRIWKLSLPKKKLLEFAGRLGSDVPFFLYDCSWALGRDRGDTITPLKISAKLWHILIVPEIKVYTKDIFKSFSLPQKPLFQGAKERPTNMLTNKKGNVNILTRALQKKDFSRIGTHLFNDLETAIVKRFPRLLELKERLTEVKVYGVCFSGSGPSVFGLTNSRKEAETAKHKLRGSGHRLFVVRTF